MWNIAILEDDPVFSKNLKGMLYEYFDAKKMEIQHFDCYCDGATLLGAKPDYDLLCLDIEVGKENGIEIAKQLRKRLPDVIILVITSYLKYSMDGYKIQAARYLLKPVPKALLFSELEEVLSSFHQNSYLLIHHKEEDHRIQQKEVFYIESYGRKSKVYTRHDEFTSEDAIGLWQKRLDETQFVQCYKGILVHLLHVDAIYKDTLQLENGQLLPLARRRESSIRNAWIAYQERLL